MTYAELRRRMPDGKESHQETQTRTLTFGRFAVLSSSTIDGIIVDPDVAMLIQHRCWCKSSGYPATRIGGELVRLHDFIMSLDYDEKPVGCYVDHINHDKLDNRRTNLRFVTPSESALNMPLRSDNKSGHVGVCQRKDGKYRAYITIGGKQLSLGVYSKYEDAVKARVNAEDSLGVTSRSCKRNVAFMLALHKEKQDGNEQET